MIAFGLLAVGATLHTGLFWLDQFGGILGNLLLGLDLRAVNTMGVIGAIWVLAGALWFSKKKFSWGAKVSRIVYTLAILGLVFSPLIVTVFNVSLRTGDVLGQTVGEESEGKNFFGNKYSYLILFAIIGIPVMGYLLLRKTKKYAFLAVPLVWLIVTFFMAWGKLKFTYYWGLPLALAGSVVLVLGLKWMARRSVNVKKLAAFGIGFMIFSGVAIGTLFVTQNVPNIENSFGWKKALFWADETLPKDARFFNWWDEGHWISFLSNRKVLIDNRNADTSATKDVAAFMISTDAEEAYQLVKKYESTHLIFGDDLLGKMPNLGFYAYNITNASDSRIQGIFGTVINCSQRETALTKEVSIVCGGNTFPQGEFEALPSVWQQDPNTLIAQNTPGFVYREGDGSKIYVFSTRANELMLVRLWMGDPAVREKFTEIYRNSGGVRIFEVS
jgi:asparagine N-glycosylation enzyme membrane subunit Stt3